MSFKEQLQKKKAADRAIVQNDRDQRKSTRENRRNWKEDYQPPMGLHELGVVDRQTLRHTELLMAQYLEMNEVQREAMIQKKRIAQELKDLCETHGLDRFCIDDMSLNYFEMRRTSIVKSLLIESGVPLAKILKATKVTTSKQLRISTPKQETQYEDQENDTED